MAKQITREKAQELFLSMLKGANVDLAAMVEERLKKALEPLEARLKEQQTTHFSDIMRGHGRSDAEERKAKSAAVGRMVRLLAMAKGDHEKAIVFATKMFGAEDMAVKALSAGQADAGGFLVSPEFSTEVIELLRPMSVVRRMNPTTLPMDQGALSIPKLTGGATAAYTGEGQNIGSSQQTTGMLDLVWKKLAALVPISNDLLRFSTVSPNADAVVRDDIVSAMALREDLAFIRGDGLTGTPKGLRNWAPAANVLTVNATVNLANITVDLGTLVLALENADVRMIRPGWLMAPRTKHFLMTIRDGNGNFAFREEMLAGKLWGFPFATTTQIPINLAVTGTAESEIYMTDFVDAVIAEASEIVIDASPNAAYFDSASSAVVSSFSRDETVIRAISRHDFGMRHDASVAVLSDVDWV